MDLASSFDSFGYEYFLYTTNILIMIFHIFDFNAAGERVLLEIRVQYIELYNI